MTTRRDFAAARTDDRPTLHVSGPADLLQAVPYLLGFHPHDSLVLIGLDETALVVTARLDLADVAEPGLLGHLVTAIVQGGASRLVVAVYDSEPVGPGPAGLPWHGIAGELATECDRAGCELADVLRVAGGRWWSYGCGDEWRCPPEGAPLPGAPSRFAVEATYAGLVALPDRAALVATLAPLPAAERERLVPLLEREEAAALKATAAGRQPALERTVRRELGALARAADRTGAAPTLPEDRVARLAAGLSVTRVRDTLWLAIERRRLDGRQLWQELARRLPGPYDAAPLFLYGWASWGAGTGALAAVAAERALASHPGYGAAQMLQSVLAGGVDPRRFPRLTELAALSDTSVA
jgi:hypothetical protein